MDFGVMMLVTDYSLDAASVARAAEERGFESFFVPEHTHVPVSMATPLPGGLEIPPEALQGIDPFITLAVAAAATSRLRLGTGVCQVPLRHPIQLAKQVASIDVVSGGRFLFGVGAGWNREEMLNHGADPRTRTARLLEHVAAMKRIWTTHEASFAGRFVNFEPLWSVPKPVQRPHPPILYGGNGPHAIDRVLELDAEWMPWHALLGEDFADDVAELRQRAALAGRMSVPVTVFDAPADEEILDGYREAGVSRCVFPLPPASADEVLAIMDWYAEVAEELR
ncbi:LLM class F420-dependent oxidoreductase [Actinoplanes regularis]|uniref:Probable F420-dependent oxidoreductase, Rv2161c family n=1 Tax=Actinoplanes regularis TaxID=52697 RepID=A0A238VZJ6_9ACTN|nr:LLM class F420-dependent oxidoreductase [Actinoplanes regularis]GIE91940.1 LLM class F420-dependent oxidoreductase [Actinoplanes regularis]GLW27608.1 LLM class F420-dependent oxidoreductase [Actinoplanes regularis]SNR39534.1 probable F420-dependent oxidoreductase, Rv2161c family [Actinoplanes regularis]